VQALARPITSSKQNRTFVAALAAVVNIPVEVEKLFVVVPHELPGREQLGEIVRGIGTEPGELPDGPELETLLDAACGLTRDEAESAFSTTARFRARWRLQPSASEVVVAAVRKCLFF
jgi:hypothetical protein